MAKRRTGVKYSQVSFVDVAETVFRAMDVRLEFIIAIASGLANSKVELERWREERVREGREEFDRWLLTETQKEVLNWFEEIPRV